MSDASDTTVWLPIKTAPRDGRVVTMRQGEWAPFHARWVNGGWQPIEFHHGLPATHWDAAGHKDVGSAENV